MSAPSPIPPSGRPRPQGPGLEDDGTDPFDRFGGDNPPASGQAILLDLHEGEAAIPHPDAYGWTTDDDYGPGHPPAPRQPAPAARQAAGQFPRLPSVMPPMPVVEASPQDEAPDGPSAHPGARFGAENLATPESDAPPSLHVLTSAPVDAVPPNSAQAARHPLGSPPSSVEQVQAVPAAASGSVPFLAPPPFRTSSQATPLSTPPPATLVQALALLEASGYAYGIERGEPAGEFLSAMIFCIRKLGEVTDLAQSDAAKATREAEARFAALHMVAVSEFQAVVAEQGKAAADHLQVVKHLSQAASLAVSQAKNAQLALIVEKENLAARIVTDVMPTMVGMLQKVLVIKEKAWNDAARFQHYLAAGLVALALFGGGFGLRAYLGGGNGDAIVACLGHASVAANGHSYCDTTNFTSAAH